MTAAWVEGRGFGWTFQLSFTDMKDNINKNLSLAEFDVRTVSNGPSVFFPLRFMAQARSQKYYWENEVP